MPMLAPDAYVDAVDREALPRAPARCRRPTGLGVGPRRRALRRTRRRPRRARTSPARQHGARAGGGARFCSRTRSAGARWPSVSLRSLKRSRSISSRATDVSAGPRRRVELLAAGRRSRWRPVWAGPGEGRRLSARRRTLGRARGTLGDREPGAGPIDGERGRRRRARRATSGGVGGEPGVDEHGRAPARAKPKRRREGTAAGRLDRARGPATVCQADRRHEREAGNPTSRSIAPPCV